MYNPLLIHFGNEREGNSASVAFYVWRDQFSSCSHQLGAIFAIGRIYVRVPKFYTLGSPSLPPRCDLVLFLLLLYPILVNLNAYMESHCRQSSRYTII